jgi:hypothetical protein
VQTGLPDLLNIEECPNQICSAAISFHLPRVTFFPPTAPLDYRSLRASSWSSLAPTRPLASDRDARHNFSVCSYDGVLWARLVAGAPIFSREFRRPLLETLTCFSYRVFCCCPFRSLLLAFSSHPSLEMDQSEKDRQKRTH